MNQKITIEDKIEFNLLERSFICDTIAKDSERKLELQLVNIHDLYTSFSVLGLDTQKLKSLNETISLVLVELEHIQNIASFGTTSDEEVLLNLKELIKEN